MKVLYWTQHFYPHIGGIEVHASHFLPAMRSLGYEFAVVTSHGSLNLPDEDIYKGVPVYRFPFQSGLAERNIEQLALIKRRLVQLKQTFKPDVVHIQFNDPSSMFHIQTAAAHPTSTLISVCMALSCLSSGNDTFLEKLFMSADWVTANSEAVLSDVRKLVPNLLTKSSLIYPGLEFTDLPIEPPPFQTPKLLCLGRLVQDKGFDLAVDAFSETIKHHPSARLIIAGDGPAKVELEQQVRNLELDHAVNFLGWVNPNRVLELMNTSTVVLVPSRCQEAFGLVALQASQMARPVIAARVGGLPEVIEDGQTGLLVERENTQELISAITYLLNHSDEAIRMGQRGRVQADEKFNWNKHLEQYDELYRKLLWSNCAFSK